MARDVAMTVTRALVFTALTLSACSYDLSSHPDSCETSADCRPGYRCHVDFCVEVTGSVAGPDAGDTTSNGGSDGGSSTPVADAAAGGTGGTGGTPNAGTGGTGGTSSPPSPDGGGTTLPDAGLDAATPGVDAGPPVAPYAACTSANDCNPGETCIVGGASGVCSAPCTTPADCPTVAGTFDATPTCDAMGHCRLDCDPAFQWMLPLTCPGGLLCLGNFGDRSCFPN